MSKPTTKAPANPSAKKKAGRPELPASEKTHPRTVRLNDVRWAKYKRLGRDWLEKELDAADELEVAAGKTEKARHGTPDDR